MAPVIFPTVYQHTTGLGCVKDPSQRLPLSLGLAP